MHEDTIVPSRPVHGIVTILWLYTKLEGEQGTGQRSCQRENNITVVTNQQHMDYIIGILRMYMYMGYYKQLSFLNDYIVYYTQVTGKL